ncbi:hypothetical protein A8F94_18350 [Bacillus sp. FJAT-27225]|uniref:Bax inhibitor-1/YccA family protein n=1 Tax=Bacillus sp. FJAT-27225 TaxID=1743144 RepID=UPI00080C2282|nr:Bax inhibitor-1/YccA family protein [Bacillus sp. FJAT-27225]OCA83096.1 hypothetical protein A8F94_18350 [Bacillus sp. FJAT-27225]
MYAQTSSEHLPSVMRTFAMSIAFALLGSMAGIFVPPALFMPLVFVELGMLLFAFLIRRKKLISYTFLYTFTFLTGITTYPLVAYYTAASGGQTVILALSTTTVVFAGLGVYATKSKRDFSWMGGMLLAALLALIAISIFHIFWPLSSTGMLAFSFIGVLVFSGFILFDFSRMKHYGVTAEEVPLMALNLYLDFLNLFTSILRIFGILGSDD